MQHGFLKTAARSPELRVADCTFNVDRMIEAVDQAASDGVRLLVFPELSVTGYSCGELFLQRTLLESAKRELLRLCAATRGKNMVVAAGLPVAMSGKLYNCAALMCDGVLLGVVPKSYLPNDTEYYEGRYFAPAPAFLSEIEIGGEQVPFGRNILFECREMPSFVLAAEICADLFVGLSPSESHALAGATVIVNLSASDELVSKSEFRKNLVAIQSAKTTSAYVYCSAGPDESTDDVVFSGHCLIAENGSVIAEAEAFGCGLAQTELDLERIEAERRRCTAQRPDIAEEYLSVEFSLKPEETRLTREISPWPFLPPEGQKRAQRFENILSIQSAGLRKRLAHTGSKMAVIGVSGGLDSTLALLVSVRAMREMGRPASDVLCISMPCFGTTSRTKSNAQQLCESLGVSFRTIDIAASVRQHLEDIGHDPNQTDTAYENAQARERTQILMDIANAEGGLVIGTGDLSELALGWCTYNGDHMSMYAVNCSVPKTLVRHLVRYIADSDGSAQLQAVLYDILDTPVSPELLPTDGEEIVQKTEDIVGPYELHDFFLYYFVRFGFSPEKLLRLAQYAFADSYTPQVIQKWLGVFLRRFFSQQFKRSCVPNGPKIGSVSLSPRGDWRMPSDAVSSLWLKELENAQQE